MPLHDWSRVPAALFHDFHQSWSVAIAQALNRGRLPPGLSALIERAEALPKGKEPIPEAPPLRGDEEHYAERANRIAIKHRLRRTVAAIEIVSPGNKRRPTALRAFVEKAVDLLESGTHLLVIDFFPPGPGDPQGIHHPIWETLTGEATAVPGQKDRTLVSYEIGEVRAAYVEPIGVGDELPDMPLFLAPQQYVSVPLAATYAATWGAIPDVIRRAVETGELPGPDTE